jgi:aspartyl-tRNA(Asn)/glutamyl-tRNA(Gln) amidotransferase subunit C
MSLSNDDVRRIARLARIAIGPDEEGEVLKRLNRMLELLDQMRSVDTGGVEPMAHALDAHLALAQRLRPDAVGAGDQRALFQSVAPVGADGKPQVQDGLYLVPQVIE